MNYAKYNDCQLTVKKISFSQIPNKPDPINESFLCVKRVSSSH